MSARPAVPVIDRWQTQLEIGSIRAASTEPWLVSGRITRATGLVLHATGLRLPVGAAARIEIARGHDHWAYAAPGQRPDGRRGRRGGRRLASRLGLAPQRQRAGRHLRVIPAGARPRQGRAQCSNSLRYAAFALFFAPKPARDFGQNAFIH